MPENTKKKDTHSCTIYGPEREVKKYTIKNWFLEKAALALAFYELSIGLISIIPSIEKKPCDSKDCSSINCQLMQDENWLKRIVGNNLDIHGHVMSGLLNLGESIFEELTDDEENVTLEETQDFLSEDILKARDAAIEDLKRLGLIEGDSLNFSVEDFKSIKLSLKDINNINAISQIYAYELAIMAYDLDAVDTYYKGIKNKIEDTYYKSKSDFATSSGFERIEEYESTALISPIVPIEIKSSTLAQGVSNFFAI